MYASFIESIKDKYNEELYNEEVKWIKQLYDMKYITYDDAYKVILFPMYENIQYVIYAKSIGDSDEAKVLNRILNDFVNMYEEVVIVDRIYAWVYEDAKNYFDHQCDFWMFLKSCKFKTVGDIIKADKRFESLYAHPIVFGKAGDNIQMHLIANCPCGLSYFKHWKGLCY